MSLLAASATGLTAQLQFTTNDAVVVIQGDQDDEVVSRVKFEHDPSRAGEAIGLEFSNTGKYLVLAFKYQIFLIFAQDLVNNASAK